MIALFFDTETSGFRSSTFTPEIVQIGALLQDMDSGRVLGELNLIIKASKPIPENVAAIHGITDEISAKYGVSNKEAELVFENLVNMADIVVAHNIEFDLGIIAAVWPIAGWTLRHKTKFCTMLKSMDIVGIKKSHGGNNKWPKLTEAYAYFHDGAMFDNAHDAMADVRACRDVFIKLMPELKNA